MLCITQLGICRVKIISIILVVSIQQLFFNKLIKRCIETKELTLNSYLRSKIANEARYIVETNKSALLDKVSYNSRFYSSKPDLSIVNPSSHCGYIIMEQDGVEQV